MRPPADIAADLEAWVASGSTFHSAPLLREAAEALRVEVKEADGWRKLFDDECAERKRAEAEVARLTVLVQGLTERRDWLEETLRRVET